MSDSEVLAALQQIHFLKDVSPALLSHLAEISRIRNIPTGTIIFRQGDPADFIYLVLAGQVSIELCASGVGCQQILTVGPGELLGWSPVLEHPRFTATARAVSTTRLIEIDSRRALAAWAETPLLGYEFVKKAAAALAKRLNATRLQLLNVYGQTAPSASFAESQVKDNTGGAT